MKTENAFFKTCNRFPHGAVKVHYIKSTYGGHLALQYDTSFCTSHHKVDWYHKSPNVQILLSFISVLFLNNQTTTVFAYLLKIEHLIPHRASVLCVVLSVPWISRPPKDVEENPTQHSAQLLSKKNLSKFNRENWSYFHTRSKILNPAQ